MTYTFAYGTEELHAAGCRDLTDRRKAMFINHLQPITADSTDEALTAAARDWAEAVDAFTGDDYLIKNDNGEWVFPEGLNVEAEVVKDYRKAIRVMPCTGGTK